MTPDFYISSEEHQFMLEGRACSVLGQINGMTSDGLLWIGVVPPLFPEDKERSEILITPRLEGLGFDEMSKRDVPVYILKILNRDAVLAGAVQDKDVRLQWWGEVAKDRKLLPKLRY
jgi:hypothetical protein